MRGIGICIFNQHPRVSNVGDRILRRIASEPIPSLLVWVLLETTSLSLWSILWARLPSKQACNDAFGASLKWCHLNSSPVYLVLLLQQKVLKSNPSPVKIFLRLAQDIQSAASEKCRRCLWGQGRRMNIINPCPFLTSYKGPTQVIWNPKDSSR